MFEYLMPLLVMPTYENTVLDQTVRWRWKGRSSMASRRGVPWGFQNRATMPSIFISTTSYRAFGVPGLGLKRGLADDLVIAPVCLRAGADGDARGSLLESRAPECGRN